MNKTEKQTIKNFVSNFEDAKILEYSNFRRTLQNVANSGLNLYGFPEVPLRLEWGSTNDPVAYMSNTECYINLNSDLDQGLNLKDRKRNAIGKLTHEVFGHGLFSDFSIMNEINNSADFSILEKYFVHTSKKQLEEIKKYYNQIPSALNNMFLQLNNIIEDPVIEYLALQRYPGLADYVEFTKKQLNKNCTTHIEESLSNDMGFVNAFLMQMRNIEVETATLYFPELSKTQVVYDSIENMHYPKQRFEATGYVFTVFWERLKPIFDAVIQQKSFLDLLKKLDLPRTQNGLANQQNGSDNTANNSNEINDINQPIAQREFEKQLSQMEIEVEKNRVELNTKIAAAHPELLGPAEHFELNSGNGFVHKGYDIVVNELQTSHNAVQDYNVFFKPEYKRIAQVLAKKLNQIIKQKRTYKALYEQEEGSMIDINAYAQGNERVFMDYTSPYKYPVCSISVMIDLSGSMAWNNRIKAAMLTAMVLENFARTSKIPIEIYGHHAIYNRQTSIERFVGFDEKPSVATAAKLISCREKTSGNNRDGLAIRYGLAKLKKRPEKSKLMFILSDGNPSDDNYGTRTMKSEMPDIYKIAKKYNVQIIPVAIGDDIGSLRDIYGDNVVDGRNLNQLPQLLINKAFKKINKLL